MSSLAVRMAEREAKLRDLNSKRREAQNLNRVEVIREDAAAKCPKNAEAKKRRAEYELQEEEAKSKAIAEGRDYKRELLLNIPADQAEANERKINSKINPDKGFSSYEAASYRKYQGLVKHLKPDMSSYRAERSRDVEAFYASSGTAVHGLHRDTPEAIDRMAEDVEKQIKKREKFSRRRRHDADADIDYINERNMKFNEKLERFYGKYTKDIKDNLERGTAI